MKDAFLLGLRDQKLVERLMKEGRPGDFIAAIALVEQYSSNEGLYAEWVKSTRNEEPMDVGVMTVSERAETASLRKEVDNINCQMTGMTKQVNKLCSQQEPRYPRSPGRQRPGRQPNRYKFTADGVSIHVKSDKLGHVISECEEGRRPKKAMASRTELAATHQGQISTVAPNINIRANTSKGSVEYWCSHTLLWYKKFLNICRQPILRTSVDWLVG